MTSSLGSSSQDPSNMGEMGVPRGPAPTTTPDSTSTSESKSGGRGYKKMPESEKVASLRSKALLPSQDEPLTDAQRESVIRRIMPAEGQARRPGGTRSTDGDTIYSSSSGSSSGNNGIQAAAWYSLSDRAGSSLNEETSESEDDEGLPLDSARTSEAFESVENERLSESDDEESALRSYASARDEQVSDVSALPRAVAKPEKSLGQSRETFKESYDLLKEVENGGKLRLIGGELQYVDKETKGKKPETQLAFGRILDQLENEFKDRAIDYVDHKIFGKFLAIMENSSWGASVLKQNDGYHARFEDLKEIYEAQFPAYQTVDQMFESLVTCFPEDFRATFLDSYRWFFTSEELFTKLAEIFQQPETTSEEKMVILDICRLWIKNDHINGHDYMKEGVAEAIRKISEMAKRSDDIATDDAGTRLARILDRKVDQFDEATPLQQGATSFDDTLEQLMDSGASGRGYTSMVRAFSQDLMTFFGKSFAEISPNEFIRQAWNKAGKEENAPNISELTDGFNTLSQAIVGKILSEGLSNEQRKNLVIFFVDALSESLRLGNYHGAMAIYSALENSSISRLSAPEKRERIIDLSGKREQLERAKKILSPSNNNAGLREAHRSRLQDPKQPAFIPYIGIYLGEITIQDENPTKKDGRLNREKMQQMGRTQGQVREAQARHQAPSRLNYSLETFLTPPNLTDAALYQQSLKIQPRA